MCTQIGRVLKTPRVPLRTPLRPLEFKRGARWPPLGGYLGAARRMHLVGLQLLRERLPKVLLFDALQEGGGKKGFQAPLLPKNRRRARD